MTFMYLSACWPIFDECYLAAHSAKSSDFVIPGASTRALPFDPLGTSESPRPVAH